MKTQLVGLLLPVYQNVQHTGATPIAHRRTNVEKLEREMMNRSGLVLRSAVDQMSPDSGPGGGQTHRVMRRYDLELDMRTVALGELLLLALSLYDLKGVLVILDEETRFFDNEAAQNFVEGLDAWNHSED